MILKQGCTLKIAKVASLNELAKIEPGIAKVASEVVAKKDDNFLYFWAHAVTASDDPQNPIANKNGDIFTLDECRKAYPTFIGRNLHLDHDTSSVSKAVGKIFDAKLLHDPIARDGKGEYYIGCLCGVDKVAHPDIAMKVAHGVIDSVSMGASVERNTCSICGCECSTPEQFCKHLNNLGRIDPETGKLCTAINHGVCFTELSLVGVPADPEAKMQQVFAKETTKGLEKTADTNTKQVITLATANPTVATEFGNILSKVEGIDDLKVEGSIVSLSIEAKDTHSAEEVVKNISKEQGLEVKEPLKNEENLMEEVKETKETKEELVPGVAKEDVKKDIQHDLDKEKEEAKGGEKEDKDIENLEKALEETDKGAISKVIDFLKKFIANEKKEGEDMKEYKSDDLVEKLEGKDEKKEDKKEEVKEEAKEEKMDKKSILKNKINKDAGFRGAKNVEMIWHGTQSDPELKYKDYLFNYWDIEDALWDEYKEKESNPTEEGFDKYVQTHVDDYLEDCIAGGCGKKIEEKASVNEDIEKEAKPEFKAEEEKGKDGKEYFDIKGPKSAYKDEKGKDYHFKSKEKADKEEGFLEAEHKYEDKKEDKKASLNRKAEDFEMPTEEDIKKMKEEIAQELSNTDGRGAYLLLDTRQITKEDGELFDTALNKVLSECPGEYAFMLTLHGNIEIEDIDRCLSNKSASINKDIEKEAKPELPVEEKVEEKVELKENKPETKKEENKEVELIKLLEEVLNDKKATGDEKGATALESVMKMLKKDNKVEEKVEVKTEEKAPVLPEEAKKEDIKEEVKENGQVEIAPKAEEKPEIKKEEGCNKEAVSLDEFTFGDRYDKAILNERKKQEQLNKEVEEEKALQEEVIKQMQEKIKRDENREPTDEELAEIEKEEGLPTLANITSINLIKTANLIDSKWVFGIKGSENVVALNVKDLIVDAALKEKLDYLTSKEFKTALMNKFNEKKAFDNNAVIEVVANFNEKIKNKSDEAKSKIEVSTKKAPVQTDAQKGVKADKSGTPQDMTDAGKAQKADTVNKKEEASAVETSTKKAPETKDTTIVAALKNRLHASEKKTASLQQELANLKKQSELNKKMSRCKELVEKTISRGLLEVKEEYRQEELKKGASPIKAKEAAIKRTAENLLSDLLSLTDEELATKERIIDSFKVQAQVEKRPLHTVNASLEQKDNLKSIAEKLADEML